MIIVVSYLVFLIGCPHRLVLLHNRIILAMSKILVIGGSGFLGTYIVHELELLGHTPIIYDVTSDSMPFIDISSSCEVIIGSVLDMDKLLSSMRGVDHVILSVDILKLSCSSSPSYHELEVNIRAAHNTISVASKCDPVKSISILNSLDQSIQFRTTYDYRSQYALGLSEQLGVRTSVINLSSVYGPGQDMESNCCLPAVLRYTLGGDSTKIYYGSSLSHFIHASDAAKSIVGLTIDEDRELLPIVNIGHAERHNLDYIISTIKKSIATVDLSRYMHSCDEVWVHHMGGPIYDCVSGHDYKYVNIDDGIREYLEWCSRVLSGG